VTKEIADRFRKMADRIELNAEEPFGGCAMIVPPGEGAAVIEMLKLDPASDPAIFWGEIKSKADQAVVDLQIQARQGMAFRR